VELRMPIMTKFGAVSVKGRHPTSLFPPIYGRCQNSWYIELRQLLVGVLNV